MTNENMHPDQQKPALNAQEFKTHSILKDSKKLYVMVSLCTKLPFVFCNPDTYDDEILLYTDPDKAKEATKTLLDHKNPLQLAKLENEQFRFFYTALYTMGVNALAVNWNTEEESHLQLRQLIHRPDLSKLPPDSVLVENPELVLTSLYLLQEMRKQPAPEISQHLKDLNEEMLADFQRGTYIVVSSEPSELPLVKQPDGGLYLPIFTDALEFAKFNRENKFQPKAVKFSDLSSILTPLHAVGIALNPLSINLPLKISAKKPQETAAASE